MFLSICVPIYNTEKYLRECLDSIVAQDLRDVEVILVDNDSTDNSPAIIAEYVTKYSQFSAYRCDRNTEEAPINIGIHHAKGTYFCVIDSDDVITEGRIARFKEAVKENAYPDIYLTGFTQFKVQKNGQKKILRHHQFKKTPVNISELTVPLIEELILDLHLPWMYFYKNDIMKSKNCFHMNHKYHPHDLYFTTFLFLYSKTIFIDNTDSYYYRIRPDSDSFNKTNKKMLTFEVIANHMFNNYQGFSTDAEILIEKKILNHLARVTYLDNIKEYQTMSIRIISRLQHLESVKQKIQSQYGKNHRIILFLNSIYHLKSYRVFVLTNNTKYFLKNIQHLSFFDTLHIGYWLIKKRIIRTVYWCKGLLK